MFAGRSKSSEINARISRFNAYYVERTSLSSFLLVLAAVHVVAIAICTVVAIGVALASIIAIVVDTIETFWGIPWHHLLSYPRAHNRAAVAWNTETTAYL